MPTYNQYQYGYQPPYVNQPYSYNQQQNTYAIVNGLEGAKQYPVLANQTILLMDSNEPIAYKKSANGLGQATIEAYRLVPVTEKQEEQPQIEYALKSDVTKLQKKIEELTKLFKKESKEEVNNG